MCIKGAWKVRGLSTEPKLPAPPMQGLCLAPSCPPSPRELAAFVSLLDNRMDELKITFCVCVFVHACTQARGLACCVPAQSLWLLDAPESICREASVVPRSLHVKGPWFRGQM